MQHLPTYKYCGLSFVLDKPGRHDRDYLIGGYSGNYFESCLNPLTRFQCEVRDLSSDTTSFLPETKVVVLLGQDALSKYFPNHNLFAYRGSPLKLNNIIYIPTFAPQDAYDRKDYENDDESEAENESEKDYQKTKRKNWRFWLRKDLQKACRILKAGHVNLYPLPQINRFPSSNEIVRVLSEAHPRERLVVDIETRRDKKITVLSFCFIPELFSADKNLVIYTVPITRYFNELAYSRLETAHILRGLAFAFNNNVVIGHNLYFDLFILAWQYRIPFPAMVFDTMLAHHRLYCEVEKSLGHCISLYTDLPYHKDEGVFEPKTPEQEQKLWSYNAKDVWTTALVYYKIREEAKLLPGAEASQSQVMRSQRPYMTMSFQGALVDTTALVDTYNSFSNRADQMKRVLKLMTGYEINPRSSQQVSKYLYDYLGLPKPDQDPTNETTLTKLYIKYGIPSIRIILDARGAGKLASSLKFKLWQNSRFTCIWKTSGTDTFRLGSSALLRFKQERGYGSNFQNWNKKIRHIITADVEKVLGQNDQAGAEALIVAYLCPPGKFRDLFLCKIKPHTYVAMHLVPEHWAKLLGVPNIDEYLHSPITALSSLPLWSKLNQLIKDSDDDPDPSKRYYYIGKQACHALNYDATWMMFQLNSLVKSEGALRLTDQEAKRIHHLYRGNLFLEITWWHEEVQQTLEKNDRVLRNLFGYPRRFGEFWGRELFKQAYAFIPQSTVGTITNLAITELSERVYNKDPLFTEARFSILNNNHDSILWQARKELAEDCSREVKKHIERELISFRGEKFKMGSEAQIGGNWGVYDEKKNPNGLKVVKI
jgi:DNA polymerase I-like protein with 3'-5' exonuclease and polymerase domains